MLSKILRHFFVTTNGYTVRARSIDLVPKKNYTYENFDAIRIQKRISASFPVKILEAYLSKFTSKEKSGGYSVYSYSRIASIERALSLLDVSATILLL